MFEVDTLARAVTLVSSLLMIVGVGCGQASEPSPPTAPSPEEEPGESVASGEASEVPAPDDGRAPCGDGPPIAPSGGDTQLAFAGRVSTATGDSVAGAAVRLVAWRVIPIDGERPCPSLVGDTTTDEAGAFLLSVPSFRPRSHVAITVEHGGLRRTYRVHDEDTSALSIRLGPSRTVPVEVRCSGALDNLESYPGSDRPVQPIRWPWLEAYWQPTGERWLERSIPVGGATRELTPLLPHIEIDIPYFDIPAGTGSFEVEVPLPIGQSTIAIRGPCGFTIRTVSVQPGEGPISAVQIALPVPENGALEIAVASGERDGRPRVLELRSGEILIGAFPVQTGQTLQIARLPAGEYRLGPESPARCRQTVAVESGATISVALAADSCVLQRPRPD